MPTYFVCTRDEQPILASQGGGDNVCGISCSWTSAIGSSGGCSPSADVRTYNQVPVDLTQQPWRLGSRSHPLAQSEHSLKAALVAVEIVASFYSSEVFAHLDTSSSCSITLPLKYQAHYEDPHTRPRRIRLTIMWKVST